MRSKLLIYSLVTTFSVVVLVIAGAVTVFAFISSDSAQAEETLFNETIEMAPIEVESVSQTDIVNPVLTHKRASYAYEGDCPFGKAKMQLTEKPTEPVIGESLLTMAE